MTGIEFVDDPDSVPLRARNDVSPGQRRSGRLGASPLAATVVGGWAAGAVLAVVAPFHSLYSLSARNRHVAGVDGWGRAGAFIARGHGPRFGVALSVCAAALLALSVLYLMSLRQFHPRRARRVVLMAASVPSVLLGIVASLVIFTQADIEQYKPPIRATWGAGVWLSIASLGCCGIATFTLLRQRLLTERPA